MKLSPLVERAVGNSQLLRDFVRAERANPMPRVDEWDGVRTTEGPRTGECAEKQRASGDETAGKADLDSIEAALFGDELDGLESSISGDELDDLEASIFGEGGDPFDQTRHEERELTKSAPPPIELHRSFDLWLSRSEDALAAALALLGLERELIPKTAPLVVFPSREPSRIVYPLPWPPLRWPVALEHSATKLDFRMAVARVNRAPQERQPDNALLISLPKTTLPRERLIVIWPLLADVVGASAAQTSQAETALDDDYGPRPPWPFDQTVGAKEPSDATRSPLSTDSNWWSHARRTCWFEPCVGAVAGLDVRWRITQGDGLPGGATRLVVLRASQAVQQADESDITPPLEALVRHLERFGRHANRPWTTVCS